MKIKTSETTVTKKEQGFTPKPDGTIEVWHSQEISQSLNYQSAKAAYGAKVSVSSLAEVPAAFEKLESLCEKPLADKCVQQTKYLKTLAS